MTSPPRSQPDTDDAEAVTILAAVRHCANSWESGARLVGNVRAGDISRACTLAIDALARSGVLTHDDAPSRHTVIEQAIRSYCRRQSSAAVQGGRIYYAGLSITDLVNDIEAALAAGDFTHSDLQSADKRIQELQGENDRLRDIEAREKEITRLAAIAECADIADDHTPTKHEGTLAAHVTGSTIAREIRSLALPSAHQPCPGCDGHECDNGCAYPGAAADSRSGTEQPARQYYYRDNKCTAANAQMPDCICWHDEGTGPYAYDDSEAESWRVKPTPLSSTNGK